MRTLLIKFFLVGVLFGLLASCSGQSHTGPWKTVGEIPTPQGYKRQPLEAESFGAYLRQFSLKPDDATVYLHTGEPKSRQHAHAAVLNIDVGTRDLQQCADAVMRLRGEYLYAQGRHQEIHFNFLNGDVARWTNYAGSDRSKAKFRKYMDWVFAYANTRSLAGELNKVAQPDQLQIGDVFIQTGNPYGHAMLVMDVATNAEGDKIFLLAQSFMPAQSIHIVVNFEASELSPWYRLTADQPLLTPGWMFEAHHLHRF